MGVDIVPLESEVHACGVAREKECMSARALKFDQALRQPLTVQGGILSSSSASRRLGAVENIVYDHVGGGTSQIGSDWYSTLGSTDGERVSRKEATGRSLTGYVPRLCSLSLGAVGTGSTVEELAADAR